MNNMAKNEEVDNFIQSIISWVCYIFDEITGNDKKSNQGKEQDYKIS